MSRADRIFWGVIVCGAFALVCGLAFDNGHKGFGLGLGVVSLLGFCTAFLSYLDPQ